MKQYRHELKFVLHKPMAEILKQRLGLIMQIDRNSVSEDHTYFIRSLYFDDPSSQAYYEKLDGAQFRKKYRIRIYNLDQNFIRLECKRKHDMMTLKQQCLISKEECSKIVAGCLEGIKKEDPLLQEFLLEMKLKLLKPSVIVDYRRLAYTYPISDVRITFDEKIRSGQYHYDLFDPDLVTYPVMEDHIVILEVKFNEVLPEAIAILLTTVPSFRQACSKFAICRSIK